MIKYPFPIKEKQILDNKVIVVYLWDDLSEITSPRLWENVECFNASGQKLWTVNGMKQCEFWRTRYGEDDFFVGTRYRNGRLQLTSFSGNSYDLNIETGHVKFFEFHK